MDTDALQQRQSSVKVIRVDKDCKCLASYPLVNRREKRSVLMFTNVVATGGTKHSALV
jgi:hypothetical protein